MSLAGDPPATITKYPKAWKHCLSSGLINESESACFSIVIVVISRIGFGFIGQSLMESFLNFDKNVSYLIVCVFWKWLFYKACIKVAYKTFIKSSANKWFALMFAFDAVG